MFRKKEFTKMIELTKQYERESRKNDDKLQISKRKTK